MRHTLSQLLLIASSTIIAAYGQDQSYPYIVSTVAGHNPLGDGGPATSALLEFPTIVGVDTDGTVYVNDAVNLRLRRISPNGIISTFVPGILVDFKLDGAGNLYGVDGGYQVFKITRNGTVSIVAGAAQGFMGDGGPATQARFNGLSGIALDAGGNIFVADTLNNRVRRIGPDGIVQTVAGNGQLGYAGDGNAGPLAQLALPQSLAVDSAGNLYIGEAFGIRKLSPSGIVSTIAGNGNSLAENGPAINAPVGITVGLAVDAAGALYVADPALERIRVITGSTIRTLAGNGTYGFSGDGGPATAAQLNQPVSVAVDSAGNVFIADQYNLRIRKVSREGIIGTVAGRSHFAGDNGPAATALLHLPTHAISDSSGNIYFSDNDNHRIRKVTRDGIVSTIAGTGVCAYSGDGSAAVSAGICYPNGLAWDAGGNLYFADSGNRVIRRIAPSGLIATIAGLGTSGDTGDGGPAGSAQFKLPFGLAFDRQGNLYVSDSLSHKVRRISSAGTIGTVAGTGAGGFAGDGGIATASQLNRPRHLATDAAGNLYISDQQNLRVRKLSNGLISTVVGTSTCCFAGGRGTNTYIGQPGGIVVDAAGNLFVSLTLLGRVAKLTPTGELTVIAGGGTATDLGDGGIATNGSLFGPEGLSMDPAGDLLVADTFNSRIRKLMLNSATGLTIAGGDGQAGAPGATLPAPLAVRVAFRAGVPVAGIPVTFAVTTGSATLSTPRGTTDSMGVAGVGLTLGSAPGPVVVTATIAGLTPVQFRLTAGAGVPLPVISAGGVVGAGASVPAVVQISPGGFATIYGANFAPEGTFRQVQASDFVNGSLPTKLAGVCVQVGSAMGFLTLVTPSQINFQVPPVPAGAAVPVQVITNCGASDEIKSAAQSVTIQAATPEFLYWVKNADGKNPVIAVNAVTGAYMAAPGLIPGLTFTAAKPGDYLIIYGISFGETAPAVEPGLPASGLAPAVAQPVVSLGSTNLETANVLYVGLSPGTAGLYQLNIKLPENLPDGDYPIVLTLGAAKTPVGGYISVRN